MNAFDGDPHDRADPPCSEAQAEHVYRQARSEFAKLATRAKTVSTGTGGLRADTGRHYWASVLFTRLAVTALSILRLAPRTAPMPDRHAHWDFSAVASLTRNLTKGYFIFYYLCVDQVADDDEWSTRLELIQLHDNATRRRMFQDLDPDHPDLPGFDGHHQDLVQRLQARHHLKSLPERRQRQMLKGDRYPYIQDELLQRMGMDRSHYRYQYRFLSAHTHTGPIAFYRMAEHGRGTGIENRADKIFMASALNLAATFLGRATDETLLLFPNAEQRGSLVHGNRAVRRKATRRRKR